MAAKVKLGHLARVGALIRGDPEADIGAVVHDSRRAVPGALFVAIKGFKHDGHDYINEAVRRGAVAVCLQRAAAVPDGVAVIQVEDSRKALAALAAEFYGWPSRRLRVIGVTGTNGKTTITHLLRSILSAAGEVAGLIGTVHTRISDRVLSGRHTTPEAVDLESLLTEMVAAGSRYAVIEVSSHALALHRVAAVEFDGAVFSNLTQDHLDFHGDLQSYLAAKALLFAGLGRGGLGGAPSKPGPKTAVLNADDPATAHLLSHLRVPALTYGVGAAADLTATDIVVAPGGLSYTLVSRAGRVPITTRLTGRFNVHNTLAAAAAALAEGYDLEAIRAGLAAAEPVPGRLEPVAAGQAFTVLVDYAHTPDGLQKVLQAARELGQGRVIVVFGAGGDRDRAKRPQMGAVAARLADITVLTSDNPRSEDPARIIADIEAGLFAAGAAPCYRVVPDRAEAIALAVSLARPGDVVLIAGKGHETVQVVGDQTLPFDDRTVARECLSRQAK